MAWDLGGNWGAERDRAAMARVLGEATTRSLLPPYPFDDRPVIAPTELLHNRDQLQPAGAESRILPRGVDWSRVDTTLVGMPPQLGLAMGSTAAGSNSWAVAGEHTASGLPLLANDPHLGIQMPSIWYQIGLHAPGLNVAGFSFAGVPGVIIGHNDHIAWSMTNVGPDVAGSLHRTHQSEQPRPVRISGPVGGYGDRHGAHSGQRRRAGRSAGAYYAPRPDY
jgi:penicillin G amidase